MVTAPPAPVPWAFPYGRPGHRPRLRALDRRARRVLGVGLLPTDAQAAAFIADLRRTDPAAERFVDATGHRAHARELLEAALGPGGVEAVPDAPAELRALCAELEQVPAWVDPVLVERGAAVWRRWGTMLFAVAGATTLEMYSEAAVSLPLALAGGYAGDTARHRFLETVRFWIEVSQPGALLRPGSAGRATAMRVRVMHVGVRRRVAAHPAWDTDRWGAPISQAWQTSTLLGGSIGPALALWPLGHVTTPAEIRALLHFQRYLGHVLGVRPSWFPETVADAGRLLLMILSSRVHDARALDGVPGGRSPDADLVESFPAGFAPGDDVTGPARWRATVNAGMYAAWTRLWTSPGTQRRHDLPSPWPWLAVALLRTPLVLAAGWPAIWCPPWAGPSRRWGCAAASAGTATTPRPRCGPVPRNRRQPRRSPTAPEFRLGPPPRAPRRGPCAAPAASTAPSAPGVSPARTAPWPGSDERSSQRRARPAGRRPRPRR